MQAAIQAIISVIHNTEQDKGAKTKNSNTPVFSKDSPSNNYTRHAFKWQLSEQLVESQLGPLVASF